MSDVVIRAEHLGKNYRIGHQLRNESYESLRDLIGQGARGAIRKVGDALRGRLTSSEGHIEEFWALRRLSFEIRRGEVVGIIGRNGAGKSTLLKILSRITEPSEGRVSIRGRVASLLEVGTGFHPEFTGRENVFLNGAILGMSQEEIRRKFDEIVAFADVERFLDTPVKRYSSGMYVRLAFAVAAHLEPEILVVDEVLAVGDAEFQKKCLGKIESVSKGGRTVLFVSHNMAAVSSLTSRGILLDAGHLEFDGGSEEAIGRYVRLGGRPGVAKSFSGRGKRTKIFSARMVDEAGKAVSRYTPGASIRLEVFLETDGSSGLSLEVFLLDPSRHKLAMASMHQFQGINLPRAAGRFRSVLEFEPLWLASGTYTLEIATSIVNTDWDHYVEDALEFEVVYSSPGGQPFDFKHSMGFGTLAMLCHKKPEFEAVP